MKCHYDFVCEEMLEETKRLTSYSHKLDIKLSCPIYENAIVVPSSYFFSGGIMDSNGNDIVSSTFNEKFHVGQCKNYDVININKDAVYIGFLHNVWGHCLTDSLKKLWYLFTEECQQLLNQDCDVIYITPNNEPLSGKTKELLSLANVPVEKFIHVLSSTRYRKIHVPDNSLICKLTPSGQDEYFFTNEFEYIYDIINSNTNVITSVDCGKIYLSRTHLIQNSRDYGEQEIECQFKKKGFRIIYPEELTLREQISIYKSCNEFASTEGSISHNAVFCNTHTKTYIVRKSYYVNGYQNIISEILDLDVTFVDAHKSLPRYQFSRESGPFYMCITSEFENFLGYRVLHLPLWLRPSWWWYCNRNRKVVHKIKNFLGVDE